MRVFYLLSGLYAASHIYILLCLRRAFGSGYWLWPVGLFLLLMAGSWLIRIGSVPVGMMDGFQTISFAWMGYALMLVLCLIALDVSGLLLRLGLRLFDGETAVFAPARLLRLGFLLSVPFFCWGLYQAQTPRTVRLTVTSPHMPAGAKPLEIVQISDLHVSALLGPKTLERMRDAIAEEVPDVLVLTGDLVDGNMEAREADAAVLRSFPARLSKIAVTGNHEAYHGAERSLEFMKRCGFTVLRSEAVEFENNIRIVGVDDDTFAKAIGTEHSARAGEMLRELAPDNFVVYLQHKPYPPDAPFDLMLSGHTHGGQIWPGIFLTRRLYGFDQGLTVLPEFEGRRRLLNISNGLGFWGPPVRLFAPPDIVRITVRPEARE